MDAKDEMLEAGERAFRRRRLAIWLLYLAAALIIVTGLLARAMDGTLRTLLLATAGLLLVSFVVLSLRYWRCPACGRRFELRQTLQERAMVNCPYCGIRLRRT